MDKVDDHADLVERIERDDALHGRRHKHGIDVAGLQTELNARKRGKRIHIGDDFRIQKPFAEMLLAVVFAVFLCTCFIIGVAAHISGFDHKNIHLRKQKMNNICMSY